MREMCDLFLNFNFFEEEDSEGFFHDESQTASYSLA